MSNYLADIAKQGGSPPLALHFGALGLRPVQTPLAMQQRKLLKVCRPEALVSPAVLERQAITTRQMGGKLPRCFPRRRAWAPLAVLAHRRLPAKVPPFHPFQPPCFLLRLPVQLLWCLLSVLLGD